MTLRRAGQKRGVVLLTRSKEDECPSVSLDLSCDSSSFDSDDCATRAEKVSDLVLYQTQMHQNAITSVVLTHPGV